VAVDDAPSTVDVVRSDEKFEYEPFYPTHEWQVVRDDQAVPAGLHIRMNFQTGIKEAKLMEGDDGSKYATKPKKPKIVLNNDGQIPDSKEKIYFTKNDLKAALNNFRDKQGASELGEDGTIQFSRSDEELQQDEKVRAKFRSMDEIRAELSDSMNVELKSDAAKMKELLFIISSINETIDQRVSALEQLEDYAHQIDNAKDLETIGAVRVLIQLLNHSSNALVENSASVISAAVQNNPTAQIAALSHGALDSVLRLLGRNENSVKKKALFALSSLLRGCQEAQQKLLQLRGTSLLHGLMANSAESAPLRLKALDILFILIDEQGESPNSATTLASLAALGWCSELPTFLRSRMRDLDGIEQIVRACAVSRDTCANTFTEPAHEEVFERTREELMTRIEEEEDAEFKEYLVGLRRLVDRAQGEVQEDVTL